MPESPSPAQPPSGAVFLSYASQDAEAARRICEALRAAGIEVWFDQSELRGGDAWDAKIRRQIRDCSLFLPIVSRHTQERAEGYFRLEWHLAEQRTYLMASDQPFLVPVTIDDTDESSARVPDRFRERQWMRLPQGTTPPEFAARVASLLRSEPETETVHQPAGTRRVAPPPSRRAGRKTVWLGGAVALAAVAAAVAVFLFRNRAAEPAAAAPPPAATAAQAKARALLAQAAAMPYATREDLDAAAGLLEQAQSLDPMNGAVWAAAALNDLQYLSQAIDRSPERMNKARAETARALELSPHSFAARLAHAQELFYVSNQESALPEVEEVLRGLLKESPHNLEILQFLGLVLRTERRFGEAAEALLQANRPDEAGWEFIHAGRWREAGAAADQAAIQAQKDGDRLRGEAALDLKLNVQLLGYEDADAARLTLAKLSPDELLDDYPVSFALTYYYLLRDPQKMLDLANPFPRDWISSWYYLEPKAALEGEAYKLAGQADAARVEWQLALQQIESRLSEKPDDPHLVLLRSWMEAELGRDREAETSLRLYDQLGRGQQGLLAIYSQDPLTYDAILLQLGRRQFVLDRIEPLLRHPLGEEYNLHGEVRFCPDYDPLRSDPRFQKLMRETKPAVARPL